MPTTDKTCPPKLGGVLAYRQWYDEVSAGSALPAPYQQFLELVASSELLQLLCDAPTYALEWRHALRAHLAAMWERCRGPMLENETMEQICVLDRLVHGMIGMSYE